MDNDDAPATGCGSSSVFENGLLLELSNEDLLDFGINSDGTTTSVTTNQLNSSSSNPEQQQHEQEQQETEKIMKLRRERRMQSNRESARRSRMKKQMQLDETNACLAQLRVDNEFLRHQVSLSMQRFEELSRSNDALRMHALELKSRLQYLSPYTTIMPQPDICRDDDDIFSSPLPEEEPFDLNSFQHTTD